jgi:hypothetical protein
MPPHVASCLVTLLVLLAVVVDEFLDAGVDEADFGEDLAGGGGPGEGVGVDVPGGDVVADLAVRAATEAKVPRRMAWRVRTPNQVSIWLSQQEPIGVKWKCTLGCLSSQAFTSGVVGVD